MIETVNVVKALHINIIREEFLKSKKSGSRDRRSVDFWGRNKGHGGQPANDHEPEPATPRTRDTADRA